MQNAMIKITGLTKSFGSLEILKGVDLSVEKGEIFALLGSNGAGKTTMIKILSTLLPPDYGSVYINNYNLKKQPLHIKSVISLTGQFAAVDEVLTGRENLILIAKLRHCQLPYNVADDLLHRFDLMDAGKTKCSYIFWRDASSSRYRYGTYW